MPLPIAFWQIKFSDQATFDVLPPGTEVPHPTIPGLWGPPRLTRRTRFPLGRGLDVLEARKLVTERYQTGQDTHYLAVIWREDAGQLQLAFFRSKDREVLQMGDTQAPYWFDPDSIPRGDRSKWDRLMDDD